MHEQTQPADARAPFDHRHQVMRFGPLDRAAQIQLVRTEDHSLGGNFNPPHTVRFPHVEHDFFVRHQLVVQRQVVAVGVEVPLIERIDDDVLPQLASNFVAGKNHVERPVQSLKSNRGLAARFGGRRCPLDRNRFDFHANFRTNHIQYALVALRVAGHANPPAVVDQSMAEVDPFPRRQ